MPSTMMQNQSRTTQPTSKTNPFNLLPAYIRIAKSFANENNSQLNATPVKGQNMGAQWRKASNSGLGECIEIKYGLNDTIHIRDDEAPERFIVTTRESFKAFLDAVKANEFDNYVEGL
jgi:hypothetical protein